MRPGGPPIRLILDKVSLTPALMGIPAKPGEVVILGRAQLVVHTGEGLLSLDRVQPAGKKVMEIAEFLRGHKVQFGERFGNPS